MYNCSSWKTMFSNDHSLNHLVLVRSLSCDHVYKTFRVRCVFHDQFFDEGHPPKKKLWNERFWLPLSFANENMSKHYSTWNKGALLFFFLVRFFVTRRCFTREREKKELKREIGNLLFKGRGNVKIGCFRDFKKRFFFSRILFSFFLLSMEFVATFLRFLMYCIFF